MNRLLVIIALCSVLVSSGTGQRKPWVSAYYAGWWQGGQLNPTEIDYDAVTHIIHFGLVLNADGTYSGDGNGLTHINIIEAVNAAHSAGKKIILCIGGGNTD